MARLNGLNALAQAWRGIAAQRKRELVRPIQFQKEVWIYRRGWITETSFHRLYWLEIDIEI